MDTNTMIRCGCGDTFTSRGFKRHENKCKKCTCGKKFDTRHGLLIHQGRMGPNHKKTVKIIRNKNTN